MNTKLCGNSRNVIKSGNLSPRHGMTGSGWLGIGRKCSEGGGLNVPKTLRTKSHGKFTLRVVLSSFILDGVPPLLNLW
ncbi:hypothetical protein RHSIM_Rhsim06G0126500 [Rhododendron simsii]|uniref:Uncharacterized protein n=1 Tax=Rhododendron simsii TaxID=118357 RepID=A0A834H4K0_RHOSS|nr:hypothetical protein RHSIM_Rhsim06G0126500 [Rhododendron simsii]